MAGTMQASTEDGPDGSPSGSSVCPAAILAEATAMPPALRRSGQQRSAGAVTSAQRLGRRLRWRSSWVGHGILMVCAPSSRTCGQLLLTSGPCCTCSCSAPHRAMTSCCYVRCATTCCRRLTTSSAPIVWVLAGDAVQGFYGRRYPDGATELIDLFVVPEAMCCAVWIGCYRLSGCGRMVARSADSV